MKKRKTKMNVYPNEKKKNGNKCASVQKYNMNKSV